MARSMHARAVRLAETWKTEPGLNSLTVGLNSTVAIPASGTNTLAFNPSTILNLGNFWTNLSIELSM